VSEYRLVMNRLRVTAAVLILLGAPRVAPAAATGPAKPSASNPSAGAASAPGAAPVASKPPSRNIGGPGDYGLRERLLHSLGRDPDIKGIGLSLILVNGGAVFSGSVPNWSIKRRALVIAGTEVGIINVTDQMDIPRGTIKDEDIQKAMGGLLGDSKDALGLKDLKITVDESVVTLEGTVTDFRSRVKAEEIAGTVLGATRIINRLRPASAPSGTDDDTIRRAIGKFLQDWHEYQFPGDFEIRVKDGRATIGGEVPLYVARQQVGNMVALVGGVREVVNEIEIDPSIQMRSGVTVKELP
jgi:osmotically-inducible protein OsmY